MGRGAVEPARHVLPGEDLDHARHRQRPLAADAQDAGMGMRRAQHLEVQQPLHRHVHGVAGVAGDDRLGRTGWRRLAPQALPATSGFDGGDAVRAHR